MKKIIEGKKKISALAPVKELLLDEVQSFIIKNYSVADVEELSKELSNLNKDVVRKVSRDFILVADGEKPKSIEEIIAILYEAEAEAEAEAEDEAEAEAEDKAEDKADGEAEDKAEDETEDEAEDEVEDEPDPEPEAEDGSEEADDKVVLVKDAEREAPHVTLVKGDKIDRSFKGTIAKSPVALLLRDITHDFSAVSYKKFIDGEILVSLLDEYYTYYSLKWEEVSVENVAKFGDMCMLLEFKRPGAPAPATTPAKAVNRFGLRKTKVPAQAPPAQAPPAQRGDDEQVKFIKGDLFEIMKRKTGVSFAHAVGKDLAMGAGIATTFKKHFGRATEPMKKVATIGETFFLSRDLYNSTEYSKLDAEWRKCLEDNKIGYIVTKGRSGGEFPTVENFRRAVDDYYEKVDEAKINEVYIPKIGAGLDRVRLDDMLKIVREASKRHSIKTTIVFLEGDDDFDKIN
jgi:hypothetical protein